MSVSLYLVKYLKLEEKYSDQDSKNLETVEMSESIYETVIKQYVCKKDFWDGEEDYSQDIISDTDIDSIVEKCVCVAKENMKKIVENNISQKEEEDRLDKLNVLLRIRQILNKKKRKYADEDNIFIIIVR